MNNKILILLLFALLAIWGITKFTSSDKGTFDPEIISVDTALVDKIVFHALPGSPGKPTPQHKGDRAINRLRFRGTLQTP